jgi:hypothetical protein
MSSKWMANRVYSAEKDRKIITMRLTGTGASTATLDTANSKGVAAITRNSVGNYDIQFGNSINGVIVPDPFVKVLDVNVTLFLVATYGPATSVTQAYVVNGSNAVNSTGVVRIIFVAANGTNAVDIANTDIVTVTFTMGDSTAP